MTVKCELTSEANRLRTVDAFRLVDTAPEDFFDEITRLTARLLGAPIVLVSIVNECEQWFKSRYGLVTQSTDRNISFCTHAIDGDGVFIIPDTHADDRFFDNPLVVGEPHIRTYMGAPLVAKNGAAIGTLCAIYQTVVQIKTDDILTLQSFASIVMRHLEMRRAYLESVEPKTTATQPKETAHDV